MSDSSRERVLKVYPDAEVYVDFGGGFAIGSPSLGKSIGDGKCTRAEAWDTAASKLSSPAGETATVKPCGDMCDGDNHDLYCPNWTCICGCKTFDEVCPRCSAPAPSASEAAAAAAAAGESLEHRLAHALAKFTYESSTGRGTRGLMPHHIRALTSYLVGFIYGEISRKVAAPIAPAAVSDAEKIMVMLTKAECDDLCCGLVTWDEEMGGSGIHIATQARLRQLRLKIEAISVSSQAASAEGDGWIAVTERLLEK